MTINEAIASLQTQINANNKFSIGNLFNTALSVPKTDTTELQTKLDELLSGSGTFTMQDQQDIQNLLDKQAAIIKERKRIWLKNFIFVTSALMGTGAVIWFEWKRRKKK